VTVISRAAVRPALDPETGVSQVFLPQPAPCQFRPDLILKKSRSGSMRAKRHFFWQSPDVMVGLDRR